MGEDVGALAAAQQVYERVAHRLLVNEFVAGLLGKCLKVPQRTRIGGGHLQDRTGNHIRQGFFGSEDGQRAVQTPRINFFINLHCVSVLQMCARIVPTSPFQFCQVFTHQTHNQPIQRVHAVVLYIMHGLAPWAAGWIVCLVVGQENKLAHIGF